MNSRGVLTEPGTDVSPLIFVLNSVIAWSLARPPIEGGIVPVGASGKGVDIVRKTQS